MPEEVTNVALTPARRQLVETMQEINYGRIEGLQVQDGEPIFDPPPTVLRLFMFGKVNESNKFRGCDRFVLKNGVLWLFEVFDREHTLSVRELIIDDGLPVRMTIAGTIRGLDQPRR